MHIPLAAIRFNQVGACHGAIVVGALDTNLAHCGADNAHREAAAGKCAMDTAPTNLWIKMRYGAIFPRG